MFRVSINNMAGISKELRMQDSCLVKNISGITKAMQQCEKLGFDSLSKQLKSSIGELVENRRKLFELILALDRIGEIYKRNEECLLDGLEVYRSRRIRSGEWINVTFSEEIMELIRNIRV